MKKIDLLIIDAQNDFCDPKGALYVKGADKDSISLADFIENHSQRLNHIFATLDSHHNYDIAHPLYWENKEGESPSPFTIISDEDVRRGLWRTSREEDREQGVSYVRALSERGKAPLTIWPPHCLIGSWGTQIEANIFRALDRWERENISMVNTIFKGSNPATEHYGALEAEIPQSDDSATERHYPIIEKLRDSDMVLIAGQALDYCVAHTIRQLAESMGDVHLAKLILLEDCSSPVDPNSETCSLFLRDFQERGMKVMKSLDVGEWLYK